jgi:pyruvate,water dikinase
MTASPQPAPPLSGTDRVLWFGDLSRDDVPRVGGKGANLGELTRAGLPVPPGFVVTAEAYLEAMERGGVRSALQDTVARTDVEDPDALARAADELRRRVRATGMPPDLREAVLEARHRLRAERVAVRSSATAEDTASTSFAGMNETFTNVHAGPELLDRIVDCWASLWSPESSPTARPTPWPRSRRSRSSSRPWSTPTPPASCSPPTPPRAIAAAS